MSAYQPPSVEEVFDKESTMDTAEEVFDYPLKDAFLVNDHYDYLDISFFRISAATPFICRYYIKRFYSNNALMDHVYSVYFKKSQP